MKLQPAGSFDSVLDVKPIVLSSALSIQEKESLRNLWKKGCFSRSKPQREMDWELVCFNRRRFSKRMAEKSKCKARLERERRFASYFLLKTPQPPRIQP